MKTTNACTFSRNATANMRKAMAYSIESRGKFLNWELARGAPKVASGQNTHSPKDRA